MIIAAWICLVSPLAAALTITLGGMRISRRAAGWIATASTTVSFAAAVVAFVGLLGTSRPCGHGSATAAASTQASRSCSTR
jgi:NADH:ubiquinone oxidoreductase subunit 5 (subunit L)/multisubunit Na+/H+ antiporter MnhA subunit